jgi:hypothetical protein
MPKAALGVTLKLQIMLARRIVKASEHLRDTQTRVSGFVSPSRVAREDD